MEYTYIILDDATREKEYVENKLKPNAKKIIFTTNHFDFFKQIEQQDEPYVAILDINLGAGTELYSFKILKIFNTLKKIYYNRLTNKDKVSQADILRLKNAVKLLKSIKIQNFTPLPFYEFNKPENSDELTNFIKNDFEKLENIAKNKFFIYTSSYQIPHIRLAFRLGAIGYFTKNSDQDISKFISDNINSTQFKVAIRTEDLVPQILPTPQQSNLDELEYEVLLLKAAGLSYAQIIDRLADKKLISEENYIKYKSTKDGTNFIEKRRKEIAHALGLNRNTSFDLVITKAFLEGVITKEMIDDIKLELSLINQ